MFKSFRQKDSNSRSQVMAGFADGSMAGFGMWGGGGGCKIVVTCVSRLAVPGGND